MPFRLEVLGGGRILDPAGNPLLGKAAQRRRIAMLTLLAAAPGTRLPRSHILGKLWPDEPERKARGILNTAVSDVRRELADDVLVSSADELRLDPAVLQCDMTEFRAAFAAGDLRRAIELYRGPLLHGIEIERARDFDDWLDLVRPELDAKYSAALKTLAERATAAGDLADAEEWWRRLAAHAPESAEARIGLMQTLAGRGERLRAIEIARTYAALLRELEMEPDHRVMELAERLHSAPAPPPDSSPPLPSPAAPPPLPGFGLPAGFQVLHQIGEGTMARVHLARDTRIGRLVAVKILKENVDETARLRFDREALTAGNVNHPNVATVLSVGSTDAGVPYIVFPYVEGGSLEDRLHATGPLAVADARRYLRQIAGGLAAAHRLRIVHRDVRPANILYDRDNDRVLLTDFGLATMTEALAQHRMRLTGHGETLGHPAYISPEQLRGDPVSDRADVYSLGVVAFELLTGRLPFDASTPIEMTLAHVRQAPRRVSELRPDVDPALDGLIARCLHKPPERRPFAADVAEELRDA